MPREENVASWDGSSTKTNIGTAYVDVYVAAGDDGRTVRVDFTGKTQVSGRLLWDKLGTGTHAVKCVNRDLTTDTLWELTNVLAGGNVIPLTTLPAWATGVKNIKLQCKSTVATDDPVFRGANINLI